MMIQIIGRDVLKIEAPQNRQYLNMVVVVEDDRFSSVNVRFSNSSGAPVEIIFSDISLGVVYCPESDKATLGELEHVRRIEGGYEVFGDFGILWVYCDRCTLPSEQLS